MKFAVENCDKISFISFQPVSFTGRDEDIDDRTRAERRYTLSHLAEDVKKQTGATEPLRDWFPLSAAGAVVLPAATLDEALSELGTSSVQAIVADAAGLGSEDVRPEALTRLAAASAGARLLLLCSEPDVAALTAVAAHTGADLLMKPVDFPQILQHLRPDATALFREPALIFRHHERQLVSTTSYGLYHQDTKAPRYRRDVRF